MARSAHALVLAALLLAAAGVHGQTVVHDNINNGVLLDPPTVISGLELDISTVGVGSFTGRTLSSTAADGATSLLKNAAANGWASTFAVSNVRGDILNGVDNALSISSRVVNTLMKPYLWLADTNGNVVYKVDTTLSGTEAVVGAYASRPSITTGNPVAFAVLSTGDAFVGNAFTFGLQESGSLTKILADNTACGTTGVTSTGISNVLPWTSAATGTITTYDDEGGANGTVQGIVGSLADVGDKCVKSWVNLAALDTGANTVSIAAVGADGFDNVYTLAVNEQIRFSGRMKIYRSFVGGSQEIFLDTYSDPTKITNRDANNTIITATSDGPGAPGGSGLVVDKWGYLWSGGGTYRKGASHKFIVIRMDTTNSAKGVQYFYLDHEAQALAFDNDGNLWVSGGGGMSLMKIDPFTIGATWAPNAVGVTNLISPGSAFINLVAIQGTCLSDDTCCQEGNYNTGIAVARQTGHIYVANECPSGKVLHFDATGALVTAIDVGTYPSAIQADATDNIWVPILVTSGANETEARATTLLKIAPGATSATNVADLTGKPYLGGFGDQTGRYSAQPPQAGTWTWVHDTGYTGYNKLQGAAASIPVAQFTGLNYTSFNTSVLDPSLTVMASSSVDGITYTNEQAVTAANTTLSLDAGRYIKVVATFTRSGKLAPEIGPQAFGVTPLLTKFQVIPRNNWPTAICAARTVNADIPTNQADTEFGVTPGAGRVCGAALNGSTAVNQLSYDPDTADGDSIVPIQNTGAFYSPTQYKLVSPDQRYTTATLTVTDAHGGVNQCSDRVNIVDTQPPAWKHQFSLANTTRPLSGDLSDISTLCIWPPNFKYYCWLDVTSNDNDQVLPLYDNCAGSVPIGKQVAGFECGDSDPRTEAGDCVLYRDGAEGAPDAKYNLCVMAQRRTVYTNTARVYQANFPVTDGSTAGVNGGTPVIYRRQVKIPPLWNFQTSGECPRPTYKAPPGTGIFYTNAARKK